MKRPGETVKLRVAFGEVPPAGVVLQLPSGRRYWLYLVRGKTLYCKVMAPGEEPPNICRGIVQWQWAGRGRERAPRSRPLAFLIALDQRARRQAAAKKAA